MQFERFYSLNYSVAAWLAHLHHLGFKSTLFQVLGKVCGGISVSVQPYAHPQKMKVLKHHIYK